MFQDKVNLYFDNNPIPREVHLFSSEFCQLRSHKVKLGPVLAWGSNMRQGEENVPAHITVWKFLYPFKLKPVYKSIISNWLWRNAFEPSASQAGLLTFGIINQLHLQDLELWHEYIILSIHERFLQFIDHHIKLNYFVGMFCHYRPRPKFWSLQNLQLRTLHTLRKKIQKIQSVRGLWYNVSIQARGQMYDYRTRGALCVQHASRRQPCRLASWL